MENRINEDGIKMENRINEDGIKMESRIKEDGMKMGIAFLVVLAVLKIAFYQEPFLIIIKLAFELFWLFIIPGFMLLYLFTPKMDFIEQFIIGTVLGLSFFGTLGYNLRLLEIRIPLQIWILPLAGISIGLIALMKRGMKMPGNASSEKDSQEKGHPE